MNSLSDLMFFLGFFLIAYILFHLHPMIVALFALTLIAALPGRAQVNIERLRRGHDTDGFVGTAAANVTRLNAMLASAARR